MEPYIVKISSKGQLTLPVEIRKKLKLLKGSKLYLVLDDDEIRIKPFSEELPVLTEKSDIFNLVGTFDGPENLSTGHDQYIAEALEE